MGLTNPDVRPNSDPDLTLAFEAAWHKWRRWPLRPPDTKSNVKSFLQLSFPEPPEQEEPRGAA